MDENQPFRDFEQRRFPDGGAWRVHPAPEALPRLAGDGPGLNRYDDPLAAYRVRYVAQDLSGALIETMARFRPSPAAESLLMSIHGADDEQPPSASEGVGDWLRMQRVGRLTLATRTPLVDVHDAKLLQALDKHPLVRHALELSGLGTSLSPMRLDEAVIRLGGPVGRPITQAVSRALREWFPEFGGVAYRSRIDDGEWCWGLWDTVDVVVVSQPLSPSLRHHHHAVRHAAALLEIDLPTDWA